MATLSKLTQRLRRALDTEHLAKQLDENILEFFGGMLKDEALSDDELVDAWLPFLSGGGADSGSASSRDKCKAVLRRLRSRGSCSSGSPSPGLSRESSAVNGSSPMEHVSSACCEIPSESLPEVRGLAEWLAQLSLSHYEAEAHAWCLEQGAADVDDVIDNWPDFSEDMRLKPLERKRVRRRCAQDTSRRNSPSANNDHGQETLEALRSPSCGPQATPDEFLMASEAEDDMGNKEFDGETFGPPENPYKIVKELGCGMSAKVYKCVRGDELYAVKVIGLARYKMQRDFNSILERLHRETAILFSLRHSNIVSLYEVIETSSRLYLVMELVEGGDLCDEILERKREATGLNCIPEYEARYIFLQIVLGLRFIHSKGVAHRDLKPENVLINRKDSRSGLLEVKISDFGHSKLVNDGYTVGMTRVGTPHYWAPEIEDSRTRAMGYDEKVDLWSLGALLYVMLEGRHPPDSSLSRCDSRLSLEAQRLVRALMQQRPQDRLSLDDCLRHPWVMTTSGPLSRVVDFCEELERRSRAESERRILLPSDPEDVRQLRRDLHILTTRLRKPVTLCRRREVAVDWSNPLSEDAWDELMCTLEKHYPDGSFLRPDVQSLECVSIDARLDTLPEMPAQGDASTCEPGSVAAASTPGRASPSHASDEELAAAAAQLLTRQDEELEEVMAAFPSGRLVVEAACGELAPVPRRAGIRFRPGRTTLELMVHLPLGYPVSSHLHLESLSLRRNQAWEIRGRAANETQPRESFIAAEEHLSSRISTQLQSLAAGAERGSSLLNFVLWLREKVDLVDIIATYPPSAPPQAEPEAPKAVQPRGPGPPAMPSGGSETADMQGHAADSDHTTAVPAGDEVSVEGTVYYKRVCLSVHHHDERMDLAGAAGKSNWKPGHSFFASLRKQAAASKVSGILSFGKPAVLVAEGPQDEVKRMLEDVAKYPWWHSLQLKSTEVTKTPLTGPAANEWRLFENFNKVETKELREVFSSKNRLDLYEAIMPPSAEKSRKRLSKANGFR
mmetsp:Transcript_158929/g.292713  ORF Transcript_158929/g.292713 Transcript_158929/m.292713 type:complete len:1016 (+) Transcript_158929:129-3176(+)